MDTKAYELSHQRLDAGLVLRVKGKFDRQAGSEIEGLLLEHARAGDVVVLTLKDVDYISSSGVAALVKLSAGQGMRIAAAAECVIHVVSLAGINSILHLYDSEADALNAAG
jgi:anti-anti-sigma factor